MPEFSGLTSDLPRVMEGHPPSAAGHVITSMTSRYHRFGGETGAVTVGAEAREGEKRSTNPVMKSPGEGENSGET
jgi:hypothetical protein